MNTRSFKSTAIFLHPFALTGYSDALPAGEYEVLIEEELLQGLSFPAYRRTATWLKIPRGNRYPGSDPIRETTRHDLQAALDRDRALTEAEALPGQPRTIDKPLPDHQLIF